MSVSWMQMTEGGALRVEAAGTKVLTHLGDEPLRLISIFGAARQGKSFLMNALSGQEGVFRVSNALEPCTQGIDLSTKTLTVDALSALSKPEGEARASSWLPWRRGSAEVASEDGGGLVGFCDAEGQGDRDVTYDARLVTPALLASRCVLFNWKDSVQKDRILNQLGVLVRAASAVKKSSDAENDGRVFGHLHMVFRDWTFSSDDPAKVHSAIFDEERAGGAEATTRNEIRRALKRAFLSVDVWLLPPPVADVASLAKGALRNDQLAPKFRDCINALRNQLAGQLKTAADATSVWGGERSALSAKRLAQVVPLLVDALNSSGAVMPGSAYAAIIEREVRQAAAEVEAQAKRDMDAGDESCFQGFDVDAPPSRGAAAVGVSALKKRLAAVVSGACNAVAAKSADDSAECGPAVVAATRLALQAHADYVLKTSADRFDVRAAQAAARKRDDVWRDFDGASSRLVEDLACGWRDGDDSATDAQCQENARRSLSTLAAKAARSYDQVADVRSRFLSGSSSERDSALVAEARREQDQLEQRVALKTTSCLRDVADALQERQLAREERVREALARELREAEELAARRRREAERREAELARAQRLADERAAEDERRAAEDERRAAEAERRAAEDEERRLLEAEQRLRAQREADELKQREGEAKLRKQREAAERKAEAAERKAEADARKREAKAQRDADERAQRDADDRAEQRAADDRAEQRAADERRRHDEHEAKEAARR
eukprot:CAMPEP_0206809312 /NCGR_PEP_ID=MMETSP0975-20121206/6182_1 /ASSEMBLY_ACC=CAM_ASM_000399 /TAXON_ID=483370 /ORGANISM="non described non described, Strain CCMP2097" /LENGTH=732 /DNA_ID=CAMNT_0054351409 /DNA_START=1 /DNA_END=2195 /DNA_ORIENTATION=-